VWCGPVMRTAEEISWREYDWLRRWNRQLEAER